MGTDTMVLIVVAAVAILVFTGMLALVAYKTRAEERHDNSSVQGRNLQHQAPAYRNEAVTSRDQLNEQRVHRLAG